MNVYTIFVENWDQILKDGSQDICEAKESNLRPVAGALTPSVFRFALF